MGLYLTSKIPVQPAHSLSDHFSQSNAYCLALLHSERPKSYTILAFLNAIEYTILAFLNAIELKMAYVDRVTIGQTEGCRTLY